MTIVMCLDAMTTPPVESMNELSKYGSKSVQSNMSIGKSVTTMAYAHDSRIDRLFNILYPELNMINRASQGPTSDDIVRICQCMVDQNYDARVSADCVQTHNKRWIAFDFKKRAQYGVLVWSIALSCTSSGSSYI